MRHFSLFLFQTVHSAGVAVALIASCIVSGTLLPSAYALEPQANDYYTKAHEAELTGNLSSAEALLRQSMALSPQDYLNYVKLAGLLSRQGKPNEATSYYRQALIINPHDVMIYYSLGGLYEQLGEYDKAERAYFTALSQNPRYQFGLLNLARAEIQLKQYEPAIINYQHFVRNYPNHYEARRRLAELYRVTEQEELAIREYTYMSQHFGEQFSEHLNFARSLRLANHPEQAIEELNKGMQKMGQNAEMSEELGHANVAAGSPENAVRHYKTAYQLNKEKPELLLAIGDIRHKQQDFSTAANYYQEFLAKKPEHVAAREMLAEAYLGGKQYQLAKQELKQILSQASDPQDVYNREKDLAYANQMLGELPEAIQRYELLKNTSFAQDDLQLKMNLAIAYQQTGNTEAAVPLYKEIDAASPDLKAHYKIQSEVLQEDLAGLLLKLGDEAYKIQAYDEASDYYKEAIRFAPADMVEPYIGLGNTYFVTKDIEKADLTYQDALRRDPENVTAKLNRAKIALLRKNNPPETTEKTTVSPVEKKHISGNLNTLNSQAAAEQEQLEVNEAGTEEVLPLLEKLAAENPGNFDVLITLADLYTQHGQYQQSIDMYNKALAIYPDNTDILLLIAAQWKAMGNLEQAKQVYLKTAELDPARSDVHYNLGIVYSELAQYPQSIAAYQKALMLDPGNTEARYGLAISLEESRNYPKAAEQYMLYSIATDAEHSIEAKQRIQALQPFVQKALPTDPVEPESKAPTMQIQSSQVKNAVQSSADFKQVAPATIEALKTQSRIELPER